MSDESKKTTRKDDPMDVDALSKSSGKGKKDKSKGKSKSKSKGKGKFNHAESSNWSEASAQGDEHADGWTWSGEQADGWWKTTDWQTGSQTESGFTMVDDSRRSDTLVHRRTSRWI